MSNKRCVQNSPKPKKGFDFKFINEKKIICYIILAKKASIEYSEFVKTWLSLWKEDFRIENGSRGEINYAVICESGHVSQRYLERYMQKVFKSTIEKYSDYSLDDLEAYRHQFRSNIVDCEFQNLKQLGLEKGFIVSITSDFSEVSGYKISLNIPDDNKDVAGECYDLTYNEALNFINNTRELAKTIHLENLLIDKLKHGTDKQKVHYARSFKNPYSTPDFDKEIINILFKEKIPYEAIIAIISICNRLGLRDLKGKPVRLLKKNCYPLYKKKRRHYKKKTINLKDTTII